MSKNDFMWKRSSFYAETMAVRKQWHCKGLVCGRTIKKLACDKNRAYMDTWLVRGKEVPCRGLRHYALGDRESLRVRGESWL